MTQAFDLIVIGTGAAGSTAAYACREARWTVAILAFRHADVSIEQRVSTSGGLVRSC